MKIGTLHQRQAKRARTLTCPRGPKAIGPDWLNRSALPVDGGKPFLDVQRPRLPMVIAAIPVEQPKGGITRLLHFCHQHASAHRMYRARRQEEAIARARLKLVQAIGDGAPGERVAKPALIGSRQQAGIDAASRRGFEYEPGFRLASFSRPEPPH